MNTIIKPSPLQERIYDFIEFNKENLSIRAVAGSGKTTTIVQSLKRIPRNKKILFLAFNRDIVTELKSKVDPNINVYTTHSFGFKSLRSLFRNPQVSEYKALDICKILLNKVDKKIQFQYYFYICDLIDMYRQNLCESWEELSEVAANHNILTTESDLNDARLIFDKMLKSRVIFDYTDMIYLPVVNEKLKVDKYDYVFVDEVQDLNKAQKALVTRTLHRKSRLITVGDPNQSIYGFAGADTNSFQSFVDMPNTVSLPLSICYRCAKDIVIEAQEIVPEIQYNPNQIKGIVRDGEITELKDGDWVLCRNVKPLIILCLLLLKNGVKCHIKGQDLGNNLIVLLRNTKKPTTAGAIQELNKKREELILKYKKLGHPAPERAHKVVDLTEKISVIEYLGKDIRITLQVIKKFEQIFSDKVKGIVLSTIHKSKGLENDRVFFLLPELIPSKYAVLPWQLLQENNLKYVAITRAKKELVYIRSLKDFKK